MLFNNKKEELVFLSGNAFMCLQGMINVVFLPLFAFMMPPSLPLIIRFKSDYPSLACLQQSLLPVILYMLYAIYLFYVHDWFTLP